MFPHFGVIVGKFSVLSPDSVKKGKEKGEDWWSIVSGPVDQ